MQRRRFVLGIGALGISALALGFLSAGSHAAWKLDPHDLAPKTGFGFGSLKFTMTDAETGKTVTAADFKGKIVMLYFGYTYCPDVCPTTLANIALVLKKLGDKAKDVRFLFVTVDPRRDTLPVLKQYAAAFAPQVIGLRGTETELKAAAAQFGARYSVHPSPDPAKYAVSHTRLIYVFNRQGVPEFMTGNLSIPDPDLKGLERDLAHLVSTNNA